MAENILVRDSEKHGGQYVATRSFRDKEAVCSSKGLQRGKKQWN